MRPSSVLFSVLQDSGVIVIAHWHACWCFMDRQTSFSEDAVTYVSVHTVSDGGEPGGWQDMHTVHPTALLQ